MQSKAGVEKLRLRTLIILVALGVCQVGFVCWTIFLKPNSSITVAGLGAELSILLRAFFSAYPYWPLMILITFGLAVHIYRREQISSRYSLVAIVCGVVITLFLSTWYNKSAFLFMLSTIQLVA